MAMNRVDRIVLDPNRTYACTRTARTGVRVTLLSNVILPTSLKDASRKQLLTHEMLAPEHQQNGLDVLRLKVSDLILLREVESDIFCATGWCHQERR